MTRKTALPPVVHARSYLRKRGGCTQFVRKHVRFQQAIQMNLPLGPSSRRAQPSLVSPGQLSLGDGKPLDGAEQRPPDSDEARVQTGPAEQTFATERS